MFFKKQPLSTNLNFHKSILLSLMFGAWSLAAFSQTEKPDYALLWEISGNGLDKPSYLFGTMHLRDNRVFEFSDSVLLKLDQCEAFASETRIDSSICQTLEIYEYGDTTNILKKTLQPYTYRKVNAAVYNTIGHYIEDLDVKHPQRIESILSEDSRLYYNEDRDAELDLFLFQRAYQQGKILYGLEYEKDYNNLIASYFKEFEINYSMSADFDEEQEVAIANQLIEFYRLGNLDSVAAYSIAAEHYSSYDYEMINGRNKTMVKNLLPLLKKQSVFVAVGAAHLPGKEGMIALLQAAGYTVEKVPATFNGPAEPPLEKTITPAAHLTLNEKDGYQFITPGQPFKVNPGIPEERITREAYYFFDIPTQVVYTARSTYYPMIPPGLDKEKIFVRNIRDWLFKRSPAENPMTIQLDLKKLQAGPYEGVSTQVEIEPGLYERIALFLEKNTLYFFLVEGKKEDLEAAAVNRFFSSIVITPPLETDWQTFTSEKGGFSIPFPHQPNLEVLEIPFEAEGGQDIRAKVFMAKDFEEGHTYLLRYFDYPVGVGVVDKDRFFESQINEITNRYQDLEPEVYEVFLDGILFKKIVIDHQNIIFNFWTGFVGNRTFMLMAVPTLARRTRPEVFDHWASQLQLEPAKLGRLQPTTIKELGLTLPLPNQPFLLNREGERLSFPIQNSYSYGSLDTTSGISFLLTKGDLHRYAWFENVDDMRSTLSNVEASEFNILYARDTIFNALPALQSVFVYPGTGNASLSLLTMDGTGYHEILINLPQHLLQDSTLTDFFKGIRFKKEDFDSSVFRPKGNLWLSDLLSANDSLVLYAKETAALVTLEVEDLPRVYQLLQQALPFDTIGNRGIKELLFEKLEVHQDAKTMDFLKELYPTLPAKEKIYLLTTLTWTEDVRGKSLFFDLVNDFPAEEISFQQLFTLFQPFRENTVIAMSYLDSLMELWENPVLQVHIALVLFTITQDTRLEFSALQAYSKNFITTARQYGNEINWSREVQDAKDPHYQTLYYLCSSILKSLEKTPELISTFRDLEDKANPEILAAILPALADLDERQSGASIEKIQGDSTEWVFYLKTLQVDGNLQKLPGRYKKQDEFLPYYLRYYGLMEDELDYKGIRFLTRVEKEWKGKQYNIYLFQMYIMNYGRKEHYWGIISQPADTRKLNTSPEVLSFYPLEKDKRSPKEVLDDIWEDFLKERR